MCHYIDQGQAKAVFYTFVTTKLLTVSCLHEFPVPQRESQPPQGLQQSPLLSHLYKKVYTNTWYFSPISPLFHHLHSFPHKCPFSSPKNQFEEVRSVFDPILFAARSCIGVLQTSLGDFCCHALFRLCFVTGFPFLFPLPSSQLCYEEVHVPE